MCRGVLLAGFGAGTVVGLKVIGTDVWDIVLTLSKKIGGDVVFDARFGDEKAVEAVAKATDGVGADVCTHVSPVCSLESGESKADARRRRRAQDHSIKRCVQQPRGDSTADSSWP